VEDLLDGLGAHFEAIVRTDSSCSRKYACSVDNSEREGTKMIRVNGVERIRYAYANVLRSFDL
jgi:hypothetical protein